MILKLDDALERTERRFLGALHAALGQLGWRVPDTDSALEAEGSDDVMAYEELPDELRDPFAALDRDRLSAAVGEET